MKDEIFEDDNFEGVPIEPPKIHHKTENNPSPSEIPLPNVGINMELDDETMRQLQKKDIINNDETYDTELGVSEKNITITNERFRGETFVDEVPVIESPKDMIDNLKNNPPQEIPKKTYEFVQDEENPIPVKNTSSQPKIQDISNEEDKPPINIPEENKTLSQPRKDLTVDDLDEDTDSKEYISRYGTIYDGEKKIQKYKQPNTTTKEYNEEPEISKTKNGIAIAIIVLLAILLCAGTYIFVNKDKFPAIIKYELTEEDKAILKEEYEFISDTEEHLLEINKLVEKEKKSIDEYISGTLSKEEILEILNDSLLKKDECYKLYNKNKPKKDEVVETKRLSDKVFNNTIAYTKDAIDSIIEEDSKSMLVGNFNSHVEENNSNIYMYNQYVMSVFQKRNISITYDGTNFAIDLRWLNDK